MDLGYVCVKMRKSPMCCTHRTRWCCLEITVVCYRKIVFFSVSPLGELWLTTINVYSQLVLAGHFLMTNQEAESHYIVFFPGKKTQFFWYTLYLPDCACWHIVLGVEFLFPVRTGCLVFDAGLCQAMRAYLMQVKPKKQPYTIIDLNPPCDDKSYLHCLNSSSLRP